MRLYDLSEQYTDLIEMLEQDPNNDQLEMMLYGINERIESKIDAILGVRNAKRAEVKALREEANRLSARALKIENEANRLESMVESTMKLLNTEKMNTPKFTTWMQANTPSVIVTDETRLPRTYFIPQPDKLDRQKLKEDIKNGVYARPEIAYLEQTKSLRVR